MQLSQIKLVSMNKLKIGVVGSNGFIGKSLVKKLKINPLISELHLFSRSNEICSESQIKIFNHRFELSIKNLIIPEALYEIEVMYYLISDSIPSISWDNPTKELSNNLIPFIDLIEKIKVGKIKKIIFTSSAGTIYGPSWEKIAENGVKNPFSPHGITKLTTEYFLEYFKNKHHINYSIFRISNIYGPGQNIQKGLGLVNTILEKHLRNEEVLIYGDGSIIRNYIFIDDVVDILSQDLSQEINESKIINLATSFHLTINEIIETIEEITNKEIIKTHLESRSADNPVIRLDNSKLIKIFPLFKNTSLKNGIFKTLKYFQNEL
jgi:UDP-glucose 4-epimerase